MVFGAGRDGFLDLERVDLAIVEGAESCRRSSFAAATQLNDLECSELERPQPHDLVTRQPCHAVIAAVKAQTTLCDRLSTIENQLPKSNARDDIKAGPRCHQSGPVFLGLSGDRSAYHFYH